MFIGEEDLIRDRPMIFYSNTSHNRVCAPGDGQDSKRSLERLMGGKVRIDQVTRDRYGRIVAQVYVSGRNLSCEQVKARAGDLQARMG
jgi:hypothetical protein